MSLLSPDGLWRSFLVPLCSSSMRTCTEPSKLSAFSALCYLWIQLRFSFPAVACAQKLNEFSPPRSPPLPDSLDLCFFLSSPVLRYAPLGGIFFLFAADVDFVPQNRLPVAIRCFQALTRNRRFPLPIFFFSNFEHCPSSICPSCTGRALRKSLRPPLFLFELPQNVLLHFWCPQNGFSWP